MANSSRSASNAAAIPTVAPIQSHRRQPGPLALTPGDSWVHDEPMPIRVFLVDDHEAVRRGVRELLEQSDGIEVVGEAACASEARSRIPSADPDVAVIDMRLPDGSGSDLCREVRTRNDRIQCVILTAYADDEALFDARVAGAAGYLLKQVRGVDVVDAVRRVAAGESLLSSEP